MRVFYVSEIVTPPRDQDDLDAGERGVDVGSDGWNGPGPYDIICTWKERGAADNKHNEASGPLPCTFNYIRQVDRFHVIYRIHAEYMHNCRIV